MCVLCLLITCNDHHVLGTGHVLPLFASLLGSIISLLAADTGLNNATLSSQHNFTVLSATLRHCTVAVLDIPAGVKSIYVSLDPTDHNTS